MLASGFAPDNRISCIRWREGKVCGLSPHTDTCPAYGPHRQNQFPGASWLISSLPALGVGLEVLERVAPRRPWQHQCLFSAVALLLGSLKWMSAGDLYALGMLCLYREWGVTQIGGNLQPDILESAIFVCVSSARWIVLLLCRELLHSSLHPQCLA